MDLMTRLQRIIREIFDNEDLVLEPTTGPAEVEGWDSVAQIKLLLAIEAEFGIRFDTEEVSSLKTVGDLARGVAAHLGKTL